MSIRMVLKSTDSKTTHTDNNCWDFRVHLPRHLSLHGLWTVKLTEFCVSGITLANFQKEIYVYCNLCDDTVIGESELPLLRRIYLEDTKNVIFQIPYKVPLRIANFRDIHLYIMDKDRNMASFLSGEVTVTLMFERQLMHD